MIRILTQAGYTVHTNDARAGAGRGQQVLTPEALRLYGLVVLNLRYGGVAKPSIPPDVIKVLVRYVETGGSLLVVASGKELGAGETGEYYNPLLKPFGLHFEPEVSLSLADARATNHPAMKNLSTFRQMRGVPVQVGDGVVLALVDDHPVIGLARYGQGRVIAAGIGQVFVGDMLSRRALGNEGQSEANRKLLVNLVSYLLNPRDGQGSTQTTMSNH